MLANGALSKRLTRSTRYTWLGRNISCYDLYLMNYLFFASRIRPGAIGT